MSPFVGQEDRLSIENLPNFPFTDAMSRRFVRVPIVNLEIKNPYTHDRQPGYVVPPAGR
jgi:hypothetical protein